MVSDVVLLSLPVPRAAGLQLLRDTRKRDGGVDEKKAGGRGGSTKSEGLLPFGHKPNSDVKAGVYLRVVLNDISLFRDVL